MKSRTPTSIRFPKGLSDWLKKRASNNERSVSGEVITLLKGLKENAENAEKQEQPANERA